MKDLTEAELAEIAAKYGMVRDVKEETVEELPQYVTEQGEYKGNPTISILLGEKRIMGFGLKKAVAILESIEDIKKFVENNK